MIITAAEERRRSLTAVFLEGEQAALIDTETFLQSGFHVGDEIGEEAFLKLQQDSNARRAKEKALYLLEHRSHSKQELIRKVSRVSGRDAAESAADRLEEIGLVDDADFARRYASELQNRKHFGKKRVRYELLQKGIEKELAEEILDGMEWDPQEQITLVLERRYPLYAEDEKVRRRAVAALQRMGYPYEQIRQAMQITEEY